MLKFLGMKTTILSILFCLCATLSFAQIRTYQISLKDSTDKKLWVLFDNFIRIENLPSDCKLKVTNGKIFRKQGENFYRVKVDSIGKTVLTIYHRSKLIFSEEFENVYWEDFKVKFGSIDDMGSRGEKYATVEDILAFPEIVSYFPSSFFKPYTVTEFNLSFFTDAKEEIKFYPVVGAKISGELLQIVRTLKKGNRVFVDDIRVLGPDGRIRHLNPFNVVIK